MSKPPHSRATSDTLKDTRPFVGPEDTFHPELMAIEPMKTMFPQDIWSDAAEAAPMETGAYRLNHLIGEGGMGEVWEAQQLALHRVVALKFVRKEGDLQLQRRFAHESHITAGLSHPNILPVYDLVDIEGRTALVMKRVQGQSWEAHLQSRRASGTLDLVEEVQRMLQVCNAVVAAHEGGVLHLDIKPGNVLVGSHGEVLLADWGCAAVFQPSDWTRAAGLPETATIHEISGTPGFMAPEQAGGDGRRLCPKTDVYLLGATLYALLEGRGLRESSSLQELLKVVAAPASLSFSEESPRSLRDLCARCLAVRPEERPASAVEFRAALQHWLDHRASELLIGEAEARTAQAAPSGKDWLAALNLYQQARFLSPDWSLAQARIVEAHTRIAEHALAREEPGLAREHAEALDDGPDRESLLARAATLHQVQQRSRRAQRWLRRVVSGAALLVAGALMMVSAFYVDSQKSLRQAKALSAFNGRILSGVRPEVAGGMDTTLLETILSDAQAEAKETFADEPALEAEVLTVVGQTYLSLDQQSGAVAALSDALDLKQQVYGEDALETVRASLLLWEAGDEVDWGSAKQLNQIRGLVEAASKAGGPAHETTLEATVLLVNALIVADQHDEALRLATSTLEALRRSDGDGKTVMELQLACLEVFRQLDRHEEALAGLERLLEDARASGGAYGELTIRAELSRITTLSGMHQYADALAALDQAIEDIETSRGADSVFVDRALSLRTDTITAAQRGGYEGVDRLVGRYVEEESARLLDPSANQRSTRGMLSTVNMLRKLDRRDQIIEFSDLALAVHPTGDSRRTRGWVQFMSVRASALGTLGRQEEARVEYEALLRIAIESLGWNARTTLTIRNNLGSLLHHMGDTENAVRLHLDNYEARKDALGPDHIHTAYSALNAAAGLDLLGQKDRAIALIEETVTQMGTRESNQSMVVTTGLAMLRFERPNRAREILSSVKTDDAALATKRDCLIMETLVGQDNDAELTAMMTRCEEGIQQQSGSIGGYCAAMMRREALAEAVLQQSGPEAAQRRARALLADPPEGDWEAGLSMAQRDSLARLRELADL